MIRTATAIWQGSLKEGKGTLNTENGTLNNTNFTYKSRFQEGEKETNPDELLTAALASCFTMEVSGQLTKKGLTQISLNTKAALTMVDKAITGINLVITGSVSGINEQDFVAIAKDASKNCIIAKTLSIPVNADAHLVTELVTSKSL